MGLGGFALSIKEVARGVGNKDELTPDANKSAESNYQNTRGDQNEKKKIKEITSEGLEISLDRKIQIT